MTETQMHSLNLKFDKGNILALLSWEEYSPHLSISPNIWKWNVEVATAEMSPNRKFCEKLDVDTTLFVSLKNIIYFNLCDWDLVVIK